jgi:type II secretory pathway pseudopilin PulG
MRLIHATRGRREAGDTIIEVLIAIAVISVVLGGAYVTTNRSLRATRSAQERGNSLKLAESQMEQLKNLVATNPDAVYGTGVPSPFCIQGTTVINPSTNNCNLDASGVPTTSQPRYDVRITRTGDIFTVRNTWIDVGGNQNAELKLTYRVYR